MDTVDGRQLKNVAMPPNIPKLHLKAISAERKLRVDDDLELSDSKPEGANSRISDVKNVGGHLLNGAET